MIRRCRRQALSDPEVQEASNGYLEVHAENYCDMIVSRPFLVPFLVPAFLLLQVPQSFGYKVSELVVPVCGSICHLLPEALEGQ